MKATTLSWDLINKMTRQMFSHDLNYEDHTVKETKVDFYGNDGVCLFKYFVKNDDPQRMFVWALILLNFVCFIIITISYTLIGFISIKSSRQLTGGHNDRQVEKRNSKMNRRISLIIASDFACWLPFISICILHSMEVVDATPWYGYFSMIVLPINSVINPLLFDDAVTSFFMTALRRTNNRGKNAAITVKVVARFRRRIQEETIELGEVKVQSKELTTEPRKQQRICDTVLREVTHNKALQAETAEQHEEPFQLVEVRVQSKALVREPAKEQSEEPRKDDTFTRIEVHQDTTELEDVKAQAKDLAKVPGNLAVDKEFEAREQMKAEEHRIDDGTNNVVLEKKIVTMDELQQNMANETVTLEQMDVQEEELYVGRDNEGIEQKKIKADELQQSGDDKTEGLKEENLEMEEKGNRVGVKGDNADINVAERTMEKQDNERAISDGDSHA